MDAQRRDRDLANPNVHRFALIVVISFLILIAFGAYVTSQASGRQPASRGVLNAVVHKDVAFVLGILALALGWQLLNQKRYVLSWIALGLLGIEGWVGRLGAPFVHASLAPLVFAIFAVIAVSTSKSWNEAPDLAKDQHAPTLRILAIATSALILLQIVLGAAYRHKLIGLMPHLGGAMVVSLSIVVLGMLVIRRHPHHRKLRSAATRLIAVFAAQVTLGFAAFILSLLNLSNPIPAIAVTASHVVVGSVTLAASLVLTIQLQNTVPLDVVDPIAKHADQNGSRSTVRVTEKANAVCERKGNTIEA